MNVLNSFKKNIKKASQDKHDIEYAIECVVEKYKQKYPDMSDEFNKILDDIAESYEGLDLKRY